MKGGDSLYRRLLAWLLIPLLLLGGLMLLQAWGEARRTADRAFDRLLEAASLAIAEQVQWQNDRLWLDLPPAALEMLATDAEERVFYALVDREGRVITGNAELPADPRAAFETAHAETGDPVADAHQGGPFCSAETGGDPTKPEPGKQDPD
jgi:two-component system sensor histidine kinase TctE